MVTISSLEKINYTLAVLTLRKIDNGNSIKFQNKYYQPYLNNELKCFMPKTDCLIIKAYDGSLVVSIDEQILELKELSRNKRFSKNFEEVSVVKEQKLYIPLCLIIIKLHHLKNIKKNKLIELTWALEHIVIIKILIVYPSSCLVERHC